MPCVWPRRQDFRVGSDRNPNRCSHGASGMTQLSVEFQLQTAPLLAKTSATKSAGTGHLEIGAAMMTPASGNSISQPNRTGAEHRTSVHVHGAQAPLVDGDILALIL